MVGFKDGVERYFNNIDSIFANRIGDKYIDDVNDAINKLTKHINDYKDKKTPIEQLKGNVAEFWHADTLNINAAVNGDKGVANVLGINDLASVDVKVGNNDYGLKYYSTAEQSAKAQATSYIEKYKTTSYFERYKVQYPNGEISFEDFLQEKGISDLDVMHDPIYNGQIRIIPSDQLEEAKEWLKHKIAKETNNRPELVKKYKDTYDKLDSIIKDDKGNESIELSRKDAEELARLGKENKFDAKDFDLTTEELIQFNHIFKQAFKAGATAMTLSIAIKIAPEIYNCIKYLIVNGELEENLLKEMGNKAIDSGAEAFIRGFVSASIVASCESGLLGSGLKNIDPSIVGVVTVLTINIMKNAIEVAKGTMTKRELANEIVKELFITTGVMSLGTLTQELIPIPILGFMIGSMVGSMVGTFIYDKGYSVVMSFFVESGLTIFGLVEQNYELPKNILDDIGIDTFEYKSVDEEFNNNYDSFKVEKFEYAKNEYENFQYDNFDIKFLRRGVIAISKIGYV